MTGQNIMTIDVEAWKLLIDQIKELKQDIKDLRAEIKDSNNKCSSCQSTKDIVVLKQEIEACKIVINQSKGFLNGSSWILGIVIGLIILIINQLPNWLSKFHKLFI